MLLSYILNVACSAHLYSCSILDVMDLIEISCAKFQSSVPSWMADKQHFGVETRTSAQRHTTNHYIEEIDIRFRRLSSSECLRLFLLSEPVMSDRLHPSKPSRGLRTYKSEGCSCRYSNMILRLFCQAVFQNVAIKKAYT